jgi:hypothetical protein
MLNLSDKRKGEKKRKRNLKAEATPARRHGRRVGMLCDVFFPGF